MRIWLSLLLIMGTTWIGCDKNQKKPDREEEEAAERTSDERTDGDLSEKMAEEHDGDEPVPSGAAQRKPRQPVRTEEVEYASIDETTITGYYAEPEDAEQPLPGLIVIQEWWGLNDNIRKMTERLAGEGYAALAVDLYEGEVAETPEQARSLMQEANGQEERLRENLSQAYAHLDEEVGAEKIGVIGWCFGGGWSLKTALMMPKKIAATVIYYGQLVTDRDELSKLEMPIIGFFGSEDNAIPPKDAREFESTLEDLDKEVSVHVYEGANHAFANPSGERYDPEAATDAWDKTVEFLDNHLK